MKRNYRELVHRMSGIFICLTLLLYVACEGDKITEEPDKSNQRKIKKSVKIHDDNINGSNLRIDDIRIQQTASYFIEMMEG